MSSAAVIAFFSLRLIEIGADAGLIGAGWAVNAVVEVPLMLAFPALVRRIGAERLLVIGAGAFALRALGFAVTDSLPSLIGVSAIGGVGFALFYVGSVTYVSRVAPPEVRATAQGLFSGTSFATGTIVGSTLGGAVASGFGLPTLFAVCTALSALAAAAVWWAVSDRGPRR
jgi:PPP family 3-phenylpropionic acid transporter